MNMNDDNLPVANWLAVFVILGHLHHVTSQHGEYIVT